MARFKKIQQKAQIVLNSQDAIKTIKNHLIPIKGEPVIFDGSVANVIDITTDSIILHDHPFAQNDQVVYTFTGGTVITGLTNNTTYYIIEVSPNIIQLSQTANGAPVNLTAVGTSSLNTLTLTQTFSGENINDVNIDNNTIRLQAGHTFISGDYIQYTATTGTAIGGLTNNQYYYVRVVDVNTIQLCNTYKDALATNPNVVNFTSLGIGVSHQIKIVVSFPSSGSPVCDIVNEKLNIPCHNFQTGDKVLYQVNTDAFVAGAPIGGLYDNQYYYIISIDTDSIQLASSYNNATSTPPNPINFTSVSASGSNHSLTKIVNNISGVPVCTNYRFRLENTPIDLSQKCRLAVQSFHYLKNYNTKPIGGIGGVYIKSLPPTKLYTSQGYYNGALLLNGNFSNTFEYQNTDYDYNSMPLPDNMVQLLQNGIDIFVDTKKTNFSNEDIKGCVDEDAFNISLIIYEIDDYEYITDEINTNVKNRQNVRFIQ